MSLVEAARRIAPVLAEADAEGRDLRRLPDRVWKHLLEGGFLRSLQPARFGGGEVALLEFVNAVIELSKASPSAGWVTAVIGVHPWQLALFAEEAQQEMWAADPQRMHSSSYNPTGKARRVDKGYLVHGRWSFSSGCDHCEGVNLGAVVRSDEPGSVPEYRSFLLHPAQYRIEDNWFVAGLQATGSKDIVVEETFVPDYRTQSHVDYAMGVPLPGQQLNDGPLYRLPWSVVFNLALAASVLGSAQGFVELWTTEAAGRVAPPCVRLADEALTQRRLAEAVWTVQAAITVMLRDVGVMWEMARAGQIPDMTQRGQWRWNLNRGCELVGQTAADLMRAASGRSIYLDHPLQSRFQDVQGGLGHAYLVSDALAKSVGGSLLGTTKPEIVL
jgi:3-hydroxy-9,10-secoandrosta-1,3,5(10)-triene-9,17-dione monooxygenase